MPEKRHSAPTSAQISPIVRTRRRVILSPPGQRGQDAADTHGLEGHATLSLEHLLNLLYGFYESVRFFLRVIEGK